MFFLPLHQDLTSQMFFLMFLTFQKLHPRLPKNKKTRRNLNIGTPAETSHILMKWSMGGSRGKKFFLVMNNLIELILLEYL